MTPAPPKPAGGAREVGGFDLRLLIAALAAWFALAVTARWSPLAVGVVAALAGALAVRCAWLGRGGRFAAGLAAASAAVVLVLAPFALRGWFAERGRLYLMAQRHSSATLRLVVGEDPRQLAASGTSGGPRVAVGTSARDVAEPGHLLPVSGSVLVLAPAAGWGQLLPGQPLEATGTLQPSLDGAESGVVLFVATPPTLTGVPPWWQRAAGVVRQSLRQAAAGLPAAERGLLPGLVDGDTSELDPVLADRFRVAGLTHLIAVSGTNCSIVVGTVVLLLRRLRLRPWLCAAVGGAVLLAFVIVARPSPSVLRAALMMVVALRATAAGRPRQAVPVLAATTLALLAWQPGLAMNAGFAMSVLATAALLLIAPGWANALRRRRLPGGVAEALAVAAAAHVVTAPVVAALNGTVSLVAIPANVLAEPAVAAATVLGFLAAVVAPAWLAGAAVLAQLAGWPCRWLVFVAERAGGIPGATLPWLGGMLGALALSLALAALFVLVSRRGVSRLVAVAVMLAATLRVPVEVVAPGWPPSGWDLVACDVGQGDGLVLSAGASSGVVVDAGPDPLAMDRCLRDLGVTNVPLLVLTHFHLDHVGGLLGVVHDRSVGTVLVSALQEPVSGVDLVRDAVEPARLRVAQAVVGERFGFGPLRLQVLAADAMHETRSDPNNSSVILRADVGNLSILLPGDAEIEEQDALLRAQAHVRADVLKIPHHGSAYSDPEFLAAVGARVGVISVGLHNDYGHPSPVLLDEMARLAVPVRRTDLDGDVAVVGDRAHLTTAVRGPTNPALAEAVRPTSARPDWLDGLDAPPRVSPGAAMPAPSGVQLAVLRHSRLRGGVPTRARGHAQARAPPTIPDVHHRGCRAPREGGRSASSRRWFRRAPGARSAPRSGGVRPRCQDGLMAERRSSTSGSGRVNARAATIDDLPDELPPLVLIVGDEELLVSRAFTVVAAAVRRRDGDLSEIDRAGAEIEGPELHELLGPSLFGDARLLAIRSAQDLRTGALAVLAPYLQSPAEGTTVVLHHAGGAKGKAVLEAVRSARPLEIPCPKLTRSEERVDFVRSEVRTAGGRIGPDAVAALVDAVGSDLRELSASARQLVSDSGGTVTVDHVRAYHQGRAEVSGFNVADLVMVGNIAGALEALRYAINLGVPHVVIADALADGVRTVARVSSAGRGNEFALAKKLSMPPWKVKRAQGQGRGWSEPAMQRALRVVADLNADVKGVAADSAYALERAVRTLGRVRAQR